MSDSCQHAPAARRLSPRAVERAMRDAARRIDTAGEKFTEPRRRALELLLAASGPVKAYDLMAQFHTDGRVAKPTTVYRALEFLEKIGMVHRISSISAYIACSEEDAHTAAFLICDCCGSTREVSPPDEILLHDVAQGESFEFLRASVELHGLCPACRRLQ